LSLNVLRKELDHVNDRILGSIGSYLYFEFEGRKIYRLTPEQLKALQPQLDEVERLHDEVFEIGHFNRLPVRFLAPHVLQDVRQVSIYKNTSHKKFELPQTEALSFLKSAQIKYICKNQLNDYIAQKGLSSIARSSCSDYRMKVYYFDQKTPVRLTLRQRGTIIVNHGDKPVIVESRQNKHKRSDRFDNTLLFEGTGSIDGKKNSFKRTLSQNNEDDL